MSQISPSGEGIDPVIESGDHQYASLAERMARLEGEFQSVAKEASIQQLRTEMVSMEGKLRTEMTSMEGRLRTEMTSMEGRLRDDMSKEIHKSRNWIMAAMFGVFAMLATQQLQLWVLMQ